MCKQAISLFSWDAPARSKYDRDHDAMEKAGRMDHERNQRGLIVTYGSSWVGSKILQTMEMFPSC